LPPNISTHASEPILLGSPSRQFVYWGELPSDPHCQFPLPSGSKRPIQNR
jgi:hypothetical protein